MLSIYIPYFAAIGAVGMVICYFALAMMGEIIDKLPTDKKREIDTINSPVPATRIYGLLFIVGYAISAYASMMDDLIISIFGTVGMVAMAMFMGTALVFSFAVYSAINSRNKTKGISA